MRSIPYVSITGEDGKQRHYETNAIPLLFHRACFGWRMYLGGPNRVVSLKEVLTTSQPAEQVIAGPETEVSADKTKATTRMLETVQDGVLQRSWCIIPGDPPGTLHLRCQHRRRAARRVRVRHRGPGPRSQYRSARAELSQQVQRRQTHPPPVRKAS